jgi:hypothetical protein
MTPHSGAGWSWCNVTRLSEIFDYSSKSGSLSKSGLDADEQRVWCCFDSDFDSDFDPDEYPKVPLNMGMGPGAEAPYQSESSRKSRAAPVCSGVIHSDP